MLGKIKIYGIISLFGISALLMILHYRDMAKISDLSVRNERLQETVQIQAKKISNTTEQLKTADKIKIKYKEFKSDDEACNYVMRFNIAKCLHD